MTFETVTAVSQPMLFVTHTAPMAEVGAVMGKAFGTLGAFIGRNRIEVAGPPLALYRDHAAGSVTMDVGFPVPQSALAKASGEIKQGVTPAGKALKAVHVGPYETLRDTYAAVEAELKQRGLPMPQTSWEVYLTEPGTTPPAEMRTEIYMPIA